MPLAVTLYSCLRNYAGTPTIEIFILDGGISRPNRTKIENVLSRFNASLNWIRIDESRLRDLPVTARLPVSAYFRLLVPELLPSKLTKAIYLDCDLIVEGDLSELWDNDVSNTYLCAATNAPTDSRPWLKDGEAGAYFNSGVLVMNLERMRETRFTEQVFDFIRKNPDLCEIPDQDALNGVGIGNWRKLDPLWNQMVTREFSYRPNGIVHYIGKAKPWRRELNSRFLAQRYSLARWKVDRLYNKYVRWSGWHTTFSYWKYAAPLLISRTYILGLSFFLRWSLRGN